MLKARVPAVAEQAVRELSSGRPDAECLKAVHQAGKLLDREGFVRRPDWRELLDGTRPTQHYKAELGEWAHGWQYFASSSREHHFRRSVVRANSSRTDRAHLESHSGRNASVVLVGAPTAKEFEVPPHEFRCLVLERLRLALPLSEATCEGCGEDLDEGGFHRAACT